MTKFCPLVTIGLGETAVQAEGVARFVVDCKVNPGAFVGHAKTRLVPVRESVNWGEKNPLTRVTRRIPPMSFVFSALRAAQKHRTFYLMNANATSLYRFPERIFAAADRGETVIIRRRRSEYVLTRKPGARKLYGCLAGSIKKDKGKAPVQWKAASSASD